MATDHTADRSTGLSRRGLLRAGAAAPLMLAVTGAAGEPAAGEPMAEPGTAAAAPMPGKAAAMATPAALEALETLSAVEMEMLEAVCARLIPTDGNGPGAREGRAAHYIDRSLAGPLSKQRSAYAAGLSALDAYARSTRGKGMASLAPGDQDAVLHDMEAGKATGFAGGSAAFFALVRAHTIEGMFCDPYYGGNANFVGWDLVGYPGLRMSVRAADQRLTKPKTLRQSAYSPNIFGRDAG